jgi:two-component sensor histidine kinase
LARTHDILTGTCWQGASLRGVLETELAPFGGAVELEGPDCSVGNHAAESLSLIIHELATNAAKYGALSSGGGRLAVTWTTEGEAGILRWAETTSRPIRPPAVTGFGTRTIRGLAASDLQGDANLDFRPEGLVATIGFRRGATEGR